MNKIGNIFDSGEICKWYILNCLDLIWFEFKDFFQIENHQNVYNTKSNKQKIWPWTTKPVLSRWGIFVTIAKNTLYGSKL